MTEQNFTTVMHLLDVLYKLWPILCGAVVVGVVWWRTRSLFFLFHQVLKWLGLEGKYSNADDQRVADEYLDLNKFNLKTGFHLRSVKAKAALHGWMREHNLEFAVLRQAGRYFNANLLKFELPEKWQTYTLRVVVIAMGMAFFSGGLLVHRNDSALLKVNATGTWFWVGKNEAYSVRFEFPEWLRGDAWRLQQGDCRYLEEPAPALDMWDKDVICRLVLGLNEGFIADAIESQTDSAWVLALFGVGCFCFIGISAISLRKAKALNAELIARPLNKDLPANGGAEPNE